MLSIKPFLWFNANAEEAIQFYMSIFKDARMGAVSRYGDSGPGPKGTVMSAEFSLLGQEFIALNGGPHFTFNEAVSFVVNCDTQEEVDELWGKLTKGGSEQPCGWLKDPFGLSWQIVPRVLGHLLSDKDAAKSQRAMQAMLGMKKLDIAALERAHRG